jgi:hypothetical protein
VPQTFGVVGVDPLIFFFQRDREGEDLALGKAVKATHDVEIVIDSSRASASSTHTGSPLDRSTQQPALSIQPAHSLARQKGFLGTDVGEVAEC